MRPAGDVRVAILKAAGELALTSDDGKRRGGTLREIAIKACVSVRAARITIGNLTRSGELEPVHERDVEYRNRPVCEYAPKQRSTAARDSARAVIGVMQLWGVASGGGEHGAY